MGRSPLGSAGLSGRQTGPPADFAGSLVQSSFVPQRPPLVKGVVVEPLPNGVYRVELENGAKILAHVADRAGTHFTRLLAGDKVGVELASHDRSRGRIREIWR
jgi:translation initiation factor IF-1